MEKEIGHDIDKYDLVENVDFVRLTNLSSESQGRGGGLNRVDYVLSVDAAKELSMVEGNEKGEAVSETGELIQQAQAPAQEEPTAPEQPAE